MLEHFPPIFMGDNSASDWPSSQYNNSSHPSVGCLANQRRFCPSRKWRETDSNISLLESSPFLGSQCCHFSKRTHVDQNTDLIRTYFLFKYRPNTDPILAHLKKYRPRWRWNWCIVASSECVAPAPQAWYFVCIYVDIAQYTILASCGKSLIS